MQKFVTYLCLFLFIVFLTMGCSTNDRNTSKTFHTKEEEQTISDKVTLTVSAAASLRDAMTDIQRMYREEHPEVKIQFNYGGSGSLKQQILQGAPVDLFISASEEHFNKLVNQELIVKEDSADLLGNKIVLIAPMNQPSLGTFEDLTSDKVDTIAIGTPESVPAGEYAKETLRTKKIWKSIQSKLIYAKDVRQVLSYVETGNVDAGIVYQTDYLLYKDKVELVDVADPESHPTIVYQAGVLKDSPYYEEAKGFFQYLQSQDALGVFEDYGFVVK